MVRFLVEIGSPIQLAIAIGILTSVVLAVRAVSKRHQPWFPVRSSGNSEAELKVQKLPSDARSTLQCLTRNKEAMDNYRKV